MQFAAAQRTTSPQPLIQKHPIRLLGGTVVLLFTAFCVVAVSVPEWHTGQRRTQARAGVLDSSAHFSCLKSWGVDGTQPGLPRPTDTQVWNRWVTTVSGNVQNYSYSLLNRWIKAQNRYFLIVKPPLLILSVEKSRLWGGSIAAFQYPTRGYQKKGKGLTGEVDRGRT